MVKKTYKEKLLDPRWQRKRLEILNRDRFACYWCGDTKSTLHVHHECYIGKNPWETPDECLTSLCEDCHSIEHFDYTELEKLLLLGIRTRDKFDLNAIKLLNSVVRHQMKNKNG